MAQHQSRRVLPWPRRESQMDLERRPCPVAVREWVRLCPCELHGVLIEPRRERKRRLQNLVFETLRLSNEESEAAAEWLELHRRELLVDFHHLLVERGWQIEEYKQRCEECINEIKASLQASRLNGV
jgi:hypothetical protein